jgi:hypothetical protein
MVTTTESDHKKRFRIIRFRTLTGSSDTSARITRQVGLLLCYDSLRVFEGKNILIFSNLYSGGGVPEVRKSGVCITRVW